MWQLIQRRSQREETCIDGNAKINLQMDTKLSSSTAGKENQQTVHGTDYFCLSMDKNYLH